MTALLPLIRLAVHGWKRWRELAADREAFAQLDESSLRDLGIARSEIHALRVDARAIQSSTRRQLAK